MCLNHSVHAHCYVSFFTYFLSDLDMWNLKFSLLLRKYLNLIAFSFIDQESYESLAIVQLDFRLHQIDLFAKEILFVTARLLDLQRLAFNTSSLHVLFGFCSFLPGLAYSF